MSAPDRILWIDASAGAAGDMILGALVDAGASFAAVKSAVARLGLDGVRLTRGRVDRSGVAAARVAVRVAGHPDDLHHVLRRPHAHEKGERHEHGRSWREIRKVIASGGLDAAVRDRALVVFRRLIEAEAEAHGMTPETVHLHEAGAADAIADVVGVCAALHDLAPARIVVSPLTTGSGTVVCAHGIYPVPGPATAVLLRGAPLSGIEAAGERLTPTGAAVLTTIAHEYGGLPAMTLRAIGCGAGSRDSDDRPNVVRAVLGETTQAGAPDRVSGAAAAEVLVVEFTVDDATPQLIAHAASRLRDAGALDVHTASVQMKKGRSGHQVTVLAPVEAFDAITTAALTETTTLGLRYRREGRIELERSFEKVATPFGPIRVKVGRRRGVELHAWPEFDDCAAAARKHGVSLLAVQQSALAARGAHRPARTTRRRGRGSR